MALFMYICVQTQYMLREMRRKSGYVKYAYPDFKGEITPEMAYVLGLIWSDGYVNINKVGLEILSSDFEDVRDIFNSLGEWRTDTRLRTGRTKPITTCYIHSIQLCGWFYDLGYFTKSIDSPNEVLEMIPSDIHKFFFKGYFDGDGCAYKFPNKSTAQLYFCGSVNQDWSAVTNLYNMLGIQRYTIKKKEQLQNGRLNRSSIVRITNKSDILRLIEYLPSMGMSRKTEKLLAIRNGYNV